MPTIELWIPIVISLITLVAGSGWLKYYLERRASQRKDWQLILEGFLLPLEGILHHNRAVFEELTRDIDLQNLEYHPDLLQRHFASLPGDDSRKITWQKRIERLLADNRRAVDLIEHNRGKIRRPEFRDACDRFKAHATQWEDLWNAVLGPSAAEVSVDDRAALMGEHFPQTLESALSTEIADLRRLAGVRELRRG